MLRWVAVPPNTRPEFVAAWRTAFAEAASAPEYIAESRKLNLAIEYSSGAEIAARIDSIFRAQSELAAELEALATCGEALAAGKETPCARS
jgi:tripartite-type tricarboxylate transporter receptor subunit TctC